MSRPVYSIWSWDRHAWGDFHFWISILFLALVAVHMILHWKWIVNSFKGRAKKPLSRIFGITALAALLAIIVTAAMPFFAKKASTSRYELQQNTRLTSQTEAIGFQCKNERRGQGFGRGRCDK